MSYCRFSSDDYQSDGYVYAGVYGGWVTHVAGVRYVFDAPLPAATPFDDEHFAEWIARERVVMDMVKRARREPLPPPHAGQDYNDDTPGGCADRLEMLRAAGFNVPQCAIDRLREEAAEQQTPPVTPATGEAGR
jgi:hypothetical protein